MKILPAIILPIAALTLTGCSAIMDAAHSESETHFDGRSELVDASVPAVGDASWLPEDASDITLRFSTNTDLTPTAVIGFAAATDLPGCASTDRLSLPSYAVEWGPADTDVVAESAVLSCGDWVFVPTDDGWFGWTPSAPGEKAAR